MRSGSFNLRDRHWELAREHLLRDRRLPLTPLAGFLLRDFAFETEDDQPPTNDDLIAAFAAVFGYNDAMGPTELEYLYDRAVEATPDWFEPRREEAVA
jgi:hypothetical protein